MKFTLSCMYKGYHISISEEYDLNDVAGKRAAVVRHVAWAKQDIDRLLGATLEKKKEPEEPVKEIDWDKLMDDLGRA